MVLIHLQQKNDCKFPDDASFVCNEGAAYGAILGGGGG